MKKVLYLGTSPDRFFHLEEVLHYPVIQLIPKTVRDSRVKFCLSQLSLFSHCIITSKNSVKILWDLCLNSSIDPQSLLRGKCISIGPVTSAALSERGVAPLWQALDATQEGIISSLQGRITKDSYVFYPRSSLARSVLHSYLKDSKIPHEVLDLYDTVYQEPEPRPTLEEIQEIVFTSPSTVDAFFQIFDVIPSGIKISFQGPITEKKFQEKIKSFVD